MTRPEASGEIVTHRLPIVFAGARIDRADPVRSDPARLAELMQPHARLLRLDGLEPVLPAGGGLSWGTLAEADPAAELVFLGLRDGEACFAAVAPGLAGRAAVPMPEVWRMIGALPDEELALYGGARMLVDWHARHRFCARCGAPTVLAKGGWQRSCAASECRADHFPRVDPVTIMLVEHEGDLLLGRQPRFPPRSYSALAGFVEPGETVEEAVAREVQEEAGIAVTEVRYVASQPWPFPSSLMIGCHARALSRQLTIDATELEDARWFTRREVELALAGDPAAPLLVPPRRAIAHQLLVWWLAQD
ncbi:NAD(+) diphosphatase [Novosphingobium piscinae]|uniref:NAD(+) diphosphatase n=1 Tax=Novosphingobium piscinae TaxID=1507448 RepID=A0A7X1FWT4_9SPHN|nr:NAD(+) diphosphatase [Novosphingobium piscinae]MBC2668401.1 NAD(+) diphosphatase [Novosphingobium piscinae]